MADIFEDEKMIFKKEVFLSVLGWSVLGYAFIVILNLIGTFIFGLGINSEGSGISLSTLGLGLLFFTLIPTLFLSIIFYIALKKNWERFDFIQYKFKFTYLFYIFAFMLVFDVIINFILTKQFKVPQFSLLSAILVFIIPYLIKTETV
jgi:hypothetical protein